VPTGRYRIWIFGLRFPYSSAQPVVKRCRHARTGPHKDNGVLGSSESAAEAEINEKGEKQEPDLRENGRRTCLIQRLERKLASQLSLRSSNVAAFSFNDPST
jgi:hypothetical protein